LDYSIWNVENKFDAVYTISTDKKFLIWDLILVNGSIFLVKDNLKQWKLIEWDISYIWNLFSQNTILFQNFISNYWYSYYFKIFNLYIQDTKYLLKYSLPNIKRHKKLKIETNYISEYKNFDKYKDYIKMWDESIKVLDYSYFENFTPWKWQNLFVFPDLWSINCFTSKISWNYDILNVSWTSLSRYKFFLDIKNWKKNNIITTHAGVFQDWKNLKSIYVFDPYKWYYKNQQNPRYYLPDLAKQIKFFYWVEKLHYVMV